MELVAGINVVIGIGGLGGRVIELLHAQRPQSSALDRVVLALNSIHELDEQPRLQKLLKEADQAIGQANYAVLSVVFEAGVTASDEITRLIELVRARISQPRLRLVWGYAIMPAPTEPDKFVPAYTTLNTLYPMSDTDDVPSPSLFDHWTLVENRTAVEASITATIEARLWDDPTHLAQGVSTIYAASLRLPVTEIAALWKVEDVLAGMDVLGIRQPESILKPMADAVVFNSFNGEVAAWRRGLSNERQWVEELSRLSDQDRLEKLFQLPLTKGEQWRKQDDAFRPLFNEKPLSQDALAPFEVLMRGCYEPEPKPTLEETLAAIGSTAYGGSKTYMEMLRQMHDSSASTIVRQFEQLTSNAILTPEEYAQVAERAMTTLGRLSGILSDLAAELSERYREARASGMNKLKTALRPPTFNRVMMKMLQGVSPEKEAVEGILQLIGIGRGRHLALVASAAFSKAAADLNKLMVRARQVDDAIVLWREALGRYRRTLIERLGPLTEGAGRVEAWGGTRKVAVMGDYPKPTWAWGLGILRCHSQNLSLTEPNVEGLLTVMPAYNDAASRLSVLAYLAESFRPEQLVQGVTRRTAGIYDAVEGEVGLQRQKLYLCEADALSDERAFVDALVTQLQQEHPTLEIVRQVMPPILTFVIELADLTPQIHLKSVRRTQAAYLSTIS